MSRLPSATLRKKQTSSTSRLCRSKDKQLHLAGRKDCSITLDFGIVKNSQTWLTVKKPTRLDKLSYFPSIRSYTVLRHHNHIFRRSFQVITMIYALKFLQQWESRQVCHSPCLLFQFVTNMPISSISSHDAMMPISSMSSLYVDGNQA